MAALTEIAIEKFRDQSIAFGCHWHGVVNAKTKLCTPLNFLREATVFLAFDSHINPLFFQFKSPSLIRLFTVRRKPTFRLSPLRHQLL